MIYLILVLYEPKNDVWKDIIKVACDCGMEAIVVDNSMSNRFVRDYDGKATIISNHTNLGIAKAQNIGVEFAINNMADAVCFFDQDSIVTKELLMTLAGSLKNDFIEIAVPVPICQDTSKEYPLHIIGPLKKFHDVYCESKEKPYTVDIAISSGTFVSVKAIKEIGYFNESLFIDFVDIEWFLRCKKKNVKVWVIPQAKMKHSIGNSNISIGLLKINVHSPYRTYYKVRNAFLIRKNGNGFLLSLWQVIPAVVTNVYTLFIKGKRFEYFKFYFYGLIDGILQRDGRFEDLHE